MKKNKAKNKASKSAKKVAATKVEKKIEKTESVEKNIKTEKVHLTGIAAKVELLTDHILIEVEKAEPAKETITESGIIIPVAPKEETPSDVPVLQGKVMAVGPGWENKDGIATPLKIKIGDTVIFEYGNKLKIHNKEYYIVTESSILVVLK